MKISIDTKEDSHDDIKKVIKMLQHLVDSEIVSNSGNIFEQSGSFGGEPVLGASETSEPTESQPTNAFSAMFGGEAPTVTFEENQDEDKEEPKDSNVELMSY